MRYRPIQAALRERVPFTLWGPSKVRTVLATVATAAVALVPTLMIASPAQAAPIDLLTISNAANWEGGDLVFTVTYSGSASASFDFAATGANGATDYNAAGSPYFGTGAFATAITFGASSTSVPSTATVTVHTLGDADTTADETFQLTASPHDASAGVGTVSATGTIWNPDPLNQIVLSGATTVPETATGGVQKTLTITAIGTNPQPHDVTIPVKTLDGSAGTYITSNAISTGDMNRDYTALPSTATIVIPAYQTSGTTTVQLWDDTADETDTQFFSVLKDAARTTLGGTVSGTQNSVQIGVQDDDATPTISVGDASTVTEGAALTFPLTLSNPSELGVTGVTATLTAVGQARGSATAATLGTTSTTPADFVWDQATAGTVTVPRYAKSTNIMIPTTAFPASTFEGPQNVNVTLSAPSDSTLGSSTTANGVINDVEAGQTLNFSSQNGTGGSAFNNSTRSFAEGNAGSVDQNIYVKFAAAGLPTTLNYTFADGTATNGTDFVGKAGSISVPADATVVSIPITVIGDRIDEANDESFKLVLTDANGIADTAPLGGQTFTITDDDAAPGWTTQDVTVDEGNSATTMARIPIVLSGPAAADSTFTAVITAGSAVDVGSAAGTNDYDLPATGSVTIKAGDSTGYLDVPINGDAVYERDESFTVVLTPPGAIPSTTDTVATSRVTIHNDDTAPTISFEQFSGSEGGTVEVNGTIVGASQYPYDLGFTVAGSGTNAATAGVDFQNPSNLATISVTVPQGYTGALSDLPTPFDGVSFALKNDSIDEATETFAVTATELTSPLKGFTNAAATVKIADDPLDLPPTAAVKDATAGENKGTVDVSVDLSFTSDNDATSTTQTVTVPYSTVDGSAKAGSDYTTTNGTLSFAPGETTKKISVPITSDSVKESSESFYVKLGQPGPAGAAVTRSSAEVVIDPNDGTTTPPSTTKPTISAPAKIYGAVSVPITGTAGSGVAVELWGAPTSGGAMVKLLALTTGQSGNFSFSRWIGVGYKFQVRSGDLVSETKTVQVQQVPVFVPTSTVKGTLSIAVLGNPRAVGQTVIVQRWVNGAWVNTWSGKTASNNQYKVSVKAPSRSVWTLRAFVAGYTPAGLLPGYSASKTITIK
jgi:Calx-beta domain-containing protein